MARDAVEADQVQRVFATLVSLVAAKGYAGTNMEEVARQSHVSRLTIKDLLGFAVKEDCYLWALEQILRHTIANTNNAYLSETDWTARLTSAYAVLVGEIQAQPDAAHVALIDAFGAGPRSVELVERAAGDFERMLTTSFAASPERVALPPLVAKGVVGGVSRVIRRLILEDRVSDLPGLADELLTWTLAYHSPAGAVLGFRAIADPTPYPRAHDRAAVDPTRQKLMHAAATIAAKHSYPKLSAETIARDASLPVDSFAEQFPGGVPECFHAAVTDLAANVATGARAAASAQAGDWPQRVLAGLRSILWRIARDRTFARLAFVEIFGAGDAGIASRTQLVRIFSGLLLSDVPGEIAPSPLVTEAIVGAVWQIAHHAVWRDATARLPALADFAGYLVLAPLLGGADALQTIHATT